MTTPTLRKRRFAISVNVLVQIIAVVLLAGAVNWIVARHYTRWDWTRGGYYELSSKTKQVLTMLKEPLEIIVFIPPAAPQEYFEKTLQDIRNLLREFEYSGKQNVRVEYIDPQRDLARARELVAKYQLDSPDLILFASGGRHKVVKLDETVDIEQMGYTEPPRVRAFKGEGVFLSAIQTVTEEKPAAVYFLTGHGERDPNSPNDPEGLAILAGYIRRDNLSLEEWNWGARQSWPTNSSALLIAGPRTKFSDAELAALDDYLKKGGRVLMLLEPRRETGLESFLANYGVKVDDVLVISPLLGMINVTALGSDYSRHPITAKLDGINTSFPYARSVRRLEQRTPGADRPEVTELVRTPELFWGEANYDGKQFTFDPNVDVPGPVSLAVAVESRKPGGVETIDATRLVVIGNVNFVDNQNIRNNEGNPDLALNALNWLLARDQMLAVGPKTPQEFRLDMSVQETRAVGLLTLVGLPLAVGILGVTVWLRRRR